MKLGCELVELSSQRRNTRMGVRVRRGEIFLNGLERGEMVEYLGGELRV